MSFYTTITENYLKHLKRGYKLLLSMLVFIIAVATYDFYTLYYYHLTTVFLICFGVILGNIVWFFGELFLARLEIKSEQRSLNNYKEMGERKVYTDALERMEIARQMYASSSQSISDLYRSQQVSMASPENKPQE